jgi:signal transduction histidine kinase
VVIKRPTGPTLLTVVLIVLLPALAILQYRWVGQVSDGERERMQRSVRNAADQFRDTFDAEITRAAIALNVGAPTAREGESDQYSDRYNAWVATAVYPQLIASIYLVDVVQGELRLRRWNPSVHVFEPSLWPAAIDHWRSHFLYALDEFNAGRLPQQLGTRLVGEESLVAIPIRQGGVRPGPRPPGPERPAFGFTILELDMPYVRNQLIPQLAERYFVNPQGDGYRVQVNATDDPTRVLYRSDPTLSIDVERADATELLGETNFFTRGGRGRGDNVASRWRLLVQHQSGSLEAAVGMIRRRNLAISFGVLLMLSVSVAMLAATSRKAERLAQQQMEFVAGVSHELRTPVAVIRSAAENLASGVVSGERVKRYGQVLEGEARRLGEMVERVLQYAGIESGLGLGTRAPLAPAEIIDSAVETAMPLLGPEEVQIHRDIAAELPPVLGDATALKSAIHNLVANAAKYGGRDRWVGIRAQHVRERRRSEVWITVSDHGPGIPAAELPHIFEPFYRGAEALEKQIHGNGLGLSLVRRIVTAHGGRVSVSTKPGAGSAFTITLPVAQADARTSTVADSAMQAGAHT